MCHFMTFSVCIIVNKAGIQIDSDIFKILEKKKAHTSPNVLKQINSEIKVNVNCTLSYDGLL